ESPPPSQMPPWAAHCAAPSSPAGQFPLRPPRKPLPKPPRAPRALPSRRKSDHASRRAPARPPRSIRQAVTLHLRSNGLRHILRCALHRPLLLCICFTLAVVLLFTKSHTRAVHPAAGFSISRGPTPTAPDASL